jgi:cytochrome c oxidase subunit 2
MPSEGPSSQEVAGRAAPVEGHGGSWAVAGLCGAGVALIGTVAALVLPGRILPRPASDAATDVVHTFQVVGVLAAVALGIVAGLAAASLVGGHVRSGDTPPPDAPARAAARSVTTLALVACAALVVAVVVWGLSVLTPAGAAGGDPVVVRVTGHQWVWTYAYPGTRVNGTSLELPLGRPVEFEVTSVDVTHGFHPIAFGTQVEASPGVVTVLRVTPDRLGPVRVQCSQLCGLLHAAMATDAEVVSPSDFAHWLVGQGTPTATARRIAGLAR